MPYGTREREFLGGKIFRPKNRWEITDNESCIEGIEGNFLISINFEGRMIDQVLSQQYPLLLFPTPQVSLFVLIPFQQAIIIVSFIHVFDNESAEQRGHLPFLSESQFL